MGMSWRKWHVLECQNTKLWTGRMSGPWHPGLSIPTFHLTPFPHIHYARPHNVIFCASPKFHILHNRKNSRAIFLMGSSDQVRGCPLEDVGSGLMGNLCSSILHAKLLQNIVMTPLSWDSTWSLQRGQSTNPHLLQRPCTEKRKICTGFRFWALAKTWQHPLVHPLALPLCFLLNWLGSNWCIDTWPLLFVLIHS